jgi:hypothetical protein
MALGRSPDQNERKINVNRPIPEIRAPLFGAVDKMDLNESMAGFSIGDFFSRQIKYY